MPHGWLQVGQVVRPHGIRGELVVRPTGDVLAGLDPGATVRVGPDEEYAVVSVRMHQGRCLVRLEGVGTRDEAESLRNAAMWAQAEQLSALPGDQFRVDELIGCRVCDPEGSLLGTVFEVVEGRPLDLLRLRTARGEALVPMVREWLREARIEERLLVIEVPAGLVEATESS